MRAVARIRLFSYRGAQKTQKTRTSTRSPRGSASAGSDGRAEEGRMGPVFSSGDEQQLHIQVRLTSSEICVTRVGDGCVFDKQRMIMIRVGLRGAGTRWLAGWELQGNGAVSGKCPLAGGPGGINWPKQSICPALIRPPARSNRQFNTSAS